MKAAILEAPKPIEEAPLRIAEVPEPIPGSGEIRIRVAACGMCHTDLHVVEGELPCKKLPIIPGHQVVGLVDAIGAGVGRFRAGDRVGLAWLYSTCGQCRFCQRGQENLCAEARFTGYDVDGGYAEYIVAPQEFAYPVPDRFSDIQAAPLLCAGIIGFRALRQAQIEKGGRLGFYGFGASAHIAIQVAVHWGCEVFVFTRSEGHRRLARELGAVWTGGADGLPPQLLDSAIIFAPVGELVPLALRALDRGGTLALAGIHMSPIPQLDYASIYHEKTVRSVANSTRQDAEDFLSLAAAIPVRTTVEVFSLEEANRTLLLLKQGSIQGAGVLMITA